jgi:hypothetical protein
VAQLSGSWGGWIEEKDEKEKEKEDVEVVLFGIS